MLRKKTPENLCMVSVNSYQLRAGLQTSPIEGGKKIKQPSNLINCRYHHYNLILNLMSSEPEFVMEDC